MVYELERLLELLDLRRLEQREHARGLAPCARFLDLGELGGGDVGGEAVGVAGRHGVGEGGVTGCVCDGGEEQPKWEEQRLLRPLWATIRVARARG